MKAIWRQCLGLSLLCGLSVYAVADMPKADEEVILFPALAWPSATETQWEVEIHGWIFEPRSELSRLFRRGLGLRPDSSEAESLLRQRSRWFSVDNERGKRLLILLDDEVYPLNQSTPNGHFNSRLMVSQDSIRELRTQSQSPRISLITQADDQRRFEGELLLLDRTGLSIISDIDDTIKISQVHSKKDLLENTFLRPFKAVPGMADLYRRWAIQGASFHYVSASPWQLYVPLREFMDQAEFPVGSFHMKTFRWKDSSVFNVLHNSIEYKTRAISELLERWPERRFVLLGDAGEHDPEIYAELARRYPEQVAAIFIRDPGEAEINPERWATAFDNLPEKLWQIFQQADEIEQDFIE